MAEDNIDHLELLTDALSIDNNVIGTDSREGCLSLLAEREFDLVVLDYNLKKKFSGFDILKEITGAYPHLPVIMVTAYGSEDLAVKVMKTGAKDYIRKTLDNNYIDRIVNNVKLLVQVSQEDKFTQNDVLKLLEDYLEEFCQLWHEAILKMMGMYEIPPMASGDINMLKPFYKSLKEDILNNTEETSLHAYKEYLQGKGYTKSALFFIEFLNISFKSTLTRFFEGKVSGGSKDIFIEKVDQLTTRNSIKIQKSFFNIG